MQVLEHSAAKVELNLYTEQLKGSLSSACFNLYGFRSGATILMALADISLDQIIDHVGRKSSESALYYKLANSLKGFSKALPE